jgi:uncharacterized peroxidase-related enzyme
MTFIETVAPEDATGAVAELYEEDRASLGHVANYTRAFSLRPGVYRAWQALSGAVRGTMDLRRYELATLAAATRLRSSYCSLAHGRILAERFLGADGVRAAVADREAAGLDETDRAVMDLAEKVAADATTVTQADVDRLRALGLTDADVLDVVLAAALRSFFSKVLDGTGALADEAFAQLDPPLREALTVGRPIQSS